MRQYDIANFKDFLYDLYHHRNISTVQIANKLNVGTTTVNTWLHYHDIPTKTYNKKNKFIKKDGYYDIESYDYFGDIIAICQVSSSDYSIVHGFIWRLSDKGYVMSHKDGKTVFMHRLILNPGKHIVDHLNWNRLDNRRDNLRIATKSTNAMNTREWGHTKSGVTGVNWRKDTEKWRAYIKVKGVQIALGSYENKDDAISARLNAEKKYFKEFAPQRQLHINTLCK